jgi:hypothetical protein
MVDRTRLKAAVEWYDELDHQPADDAIAVFVNAARAVVEAPELLWCEVHKCAFSADDPDPDVCWAWSYESDEHCRMVRVFLVPAEEETE